MLTGTPAGEPNFAQLPLRHLDALYGYARILTHDPVESEELVQEQLRPNSSFKSWMFTILRNVRFNELRRTKNGRRLLDTGEDQGSALEQAADKTGKDPYVSYVEMSEKQWIAFPQLIEK